PFPLFVPGTFSPFCAWHLFPFLCLAPFPLFVPGTSIAFGARHKKNSRNDIVAAVCINGTIRIPWIFS
ncbi:hypothetical protein, partial [Rossellomorea marisflavi]|uniref:hypothetical protein n=1 Tax=Rossellomorea marisflavi TaxID=189381 RepID=UPI003D2ECE1B